MKNMNEYNHSPDSFADLAFFLFKQRSSTMKFLMRADFFHLSSSSPSAKIDREATLYLNCLS